MKPGDLIEWFYKLNGDVVHPRETLWSSIEQRYVPIGGTHLLVSIVNGELTFLTLGAQCNGLLRAHEDDLAPLAHLALTFPRSPPFPVRVAPRVSECKVLVPRGRM